MKKITCEIWAQNKTVVRTWRQKVMPLARIYERTRIETFRDLRPGAPLVRPMSSRLIYGSSGCRWSQEEVIDSAPNRSCRKSRDGALRDEESEHRYTKTMIDHGHAIRKFRSLDIGQLSREINIRADQGWLWSMADGSTFARRWNRYTKQRVAIKVQTELPLFCAIQKWLYWL